MRMVDFKKLYVNGMPKILHMGYAEDHIPFLWLSMQGIAQ